MAIRACMHQGFPVGLHNSVRSLPAVTHWGFGCTFRTPGEFDNRISLMVAAPTQQVTSSAPSGYGFNAL